MKKQVVLLDAAGMIVGGPMPRVPSGVLAPGIVGRADYIEPRYDRETQVCTPVIPVVGDRVLFEVADKPNAAEIRAARLVKAFEQQLQARLDAWARTRGYDSLLSTCTYATSSNPQFQAEGQHAVIVRDNTWAACYQILAEVQAQQRPAPTSLQDFVAELPLLLWPDQEDGQEMPWIEPVAPANEPEGEGDGE